MQHIYDEIDDYLEKTSGCGREYRNFIQEEFFKRHPEKKAEYAARAKEKVLCDCGAKIGKYSLKKHMLSARHEKRMAAKAKILDMKNSDNIADN